MTSQKYPRTEWVHALRAYFDAKPEQLALFDVPEQPGSFPERAFFLVVADYARPDGHLVMALKPAATRWRLSEVSIGRYLRLMVRLGWLENVGHAHRGQAQVRRVVVPEYVRDLPKPTERGIPHDTPNDAKGVSDKAPLSQRKGYHRDTERGIREGGKGVSPMTPPEVDRSQSIRSTPAAGHPGNGTHPTGTPTDDVIDAWRSNFNTHMPARLRLSKSANPRIGSCVATGHTPERVARWIEQVCNVPKCTTAGPIIAAIESYAAELAGASVGPEAQTVPDALAPERCAAHNEPARTCVACRYPNGIPRLYPDAAPLKPLTSAEVAARKRAEREAHSQQEKAERAARRAERDAALAGDPLVRPDLAKWNTTPPTEAEVLDMAADLAAQRARQADQTDDTEQETA